MGAKTWMIVYSNGNAANILQSKPALNKSKTNELVGELFAGFKLTPIENGDLSYTCPPEDEIYAGCFSDTFIVAADEFGIDNPSQLSSAFLNLKYGNTIQLHAMHSAVDWFAFAVWKDGVLERSLSLSPDDGILEDLGKKYPFELPFWNGEHPAVDPEDEDEEEYPFQFHPLELGEEVLKIFFGYQLEGFVDTSLFEPEDIPLLGYKRSKPKWKFW